MTPINKQIRLFTAIGIAATIIGYIFLIYQSYTLNNAITLKKNEIQQLESIRVEKVNELKGLESKIIEITSTSKDSNTVKEGKLLAIERGIPLVNNFRVTSKRESNLEAAQKFEKLGFEFLLDKNISSSIDAFVKSENSYNGYNAVYEIARYLVKNKAELADANSEYWPIAYKNILTQYSWKMPEKYKAEFKKQVK